MHAVNVPPSTAWLPAGARPAVTRAAVTTGRSRTAVLVCFVVVYFGLQIASYTQRSATFDEPLHLAAGYAALKKGDHRMDPTHPPLVRMWAALPLLAMGDVTINTDRMNGLTLSDWMPRLNNYSHDFMYVQNDADHLLGWARFMIVLLGAGLGLLVFLWAEECLGFPTAAFALLFYLLSPNLGAHAALVTTDLGITLLYFSTIYFLWRTCRACTAGNVAGFVLSFACAIVTKFSAVLLIPTVAALLALAAVRPGPMTWRRAGALLGLLAVTTWVVIWAAYGFRYAPSDAPDSLLETWNRPEVIEHLPLLAPLMNWADALHLLPNAFCQGFLLCFSWSELFPSYLLGEIRATGGWWYYYPVAFLVKTPAMMLILLVAGLGVIIRRRGRLGGDFAAFVLLPPAIFLGFAMSTSINIGLRHILPVYPFVLLIAAVAVREILGAAWRTGTKRVVLAAVVGFWLTVFAWRYPYTLSYFNVFVGGPERGLDYLADSNVDWGQQLKRLKKWMTSHGVEQINLAYFGIADPAYYDIPCRLLPGSQDYLADQIQRPALPGYVAISATIQSGVYFSPEWRSFYAGFEHLRPVARLGHSLRIYRVDRWPVAPLADDPEDDALEHTEEIDRVGLLADQLAALGWHDYAVPYFRQFLQVQPDNLKAREGLQRSLAAVQRNAAAVAALRRAVGLDPAAVDSRHRLARLLLEQGDTRGAVEQVEAVVRLRPGDAGALDQLGVALVRDRQFEAAARALEQARQIAPDNPNIVRHLAQLREISYPRGSAYPR